MRLNDDDESVVVVPSVTLDRRWRAQRQPDAGHTRNGSCSCCCCSGSPGCGWSTSRRCRSPEHRRVLPRAAPRRHPESRRGATVPGRRCDDSSPRPLSEKLLERPRLLAADRARSIPDRVAITPRPLQHDRAGAGPRARARHPDVRRRPAARSISGTKTGCRRLFAEVGVPHPLGVEDLHTPRRARRRRSASCVRQRPEHAQVIVKLNEGVSGEGNAIVDLRGLPAPGSPTSARRCDSGCGRWSSSRRHAVRRVPRPSSPSAAASSRSAIDGRRAAEPERAAAGHADRRGRAAVDARPAARRAERAELPRAAASRRTSATPGDHEPTRHAIGERLAREGVLGRFALDFVVVARPPAAGRRTPSRSTCARAARPTRSSPCSSSPTVATTRRRRCSSRPSGRREAPRRDRPPRVRPRCAACALDDLFDIVVRHGLHFDQSRQTGVVFHMISSLTEHGRVGLTAVGDTPEEAEPPIPRGRADPARRGAVGVRGAAPPGLSRLERVWYVAYGSNLGSGAVRVLPGRRTSRWRNAHLPWLPRSVRAGGQLQPRGLRCTGVRRGVRRLGRGDGASTTRRARARWPVGPTW